MEVPLLLVPNKPQTVESTLAPLKALDPCCSEITVSLFLKDMDDGSKLIYDYGIYEFLDDPRSIVPLRDQVVTSEIFKRVYISLAGLTPSVDPASPIGLSLDTLLLGSCDDIMHRTGQKFCLHCLMEQNFSFWHRILPSNIAYLNYKAVVDLIKYGNVLVNYEKSLSYGHVFPVPLEVDKSGKHRFIAGRRDFKSFGDIAIDMSIWKVYWLAVRRTYPLIERKVWFSLIARCNDKDIPRICLDLHYKIGKQKRMVKVVVPQYSNFWSAVTHAFSSIPSSALASDSLPFSFFDDVKNLIQD